MEYLRSLISTIREAWSAGDNNGAQQISEDPLLVTQLTVDRDIDTSLELSAGRSSREVEGEDDDRGRRNKTKTSRKNRKKRQPDVPAEVRTIRVDEKVHGESEDYTGPHNYQSSSSTFLIKTELDESSCSEVISRPRSGSKNENPEKCSASTEEKKKRKNRKETETAHPVVSFHDKLNRDGNKVDSTPIADRVCLQTTAATSAVQEVYKIKSDEQDCKFETKEAISETSSDHLENINAGGENELAFHNSISGNFNVQGNSLDKKKKKKKKKKKQKNEVDSQPPNESAGAVLDTGSVDNKAMVSEQWHVVPARQKTKKEQLITGGASAKKKGSTSDAMPRFLSNKKDAMTPQATIHEATDDPCKEDEATGGYRDDSADKVSESVTEDDSSDTSSVQEKRNILCIFKLVYGVGLQALRKLFMDINPSWSNQPCDAAGFDKGKMKLNKDEEVVFNKGNINEWDFSLMTNALLFSKACTVEINKRPGFALALRELKNCRNRLLGHPCTERMCDKDFNAFWPLLSSNFVTLGADERNIAEIVLLSDEVLYSGKYYKQLFLTERAKQAYCEEKLEAIESKLNTIIAKQSPDVAFKDRASPKDLGGPNFDEWIKFCDIVGNFESHQNQYILVTDALPSEDLKCFSMLRGVSWRMVLDFDPMSEERGFYSEFTSKPGQCNLVSMITPTELRKSSMGSVLRQIDPQKIQWLFVNGRESDTEGSAQSFPDWEASSVKQITRLFGCCSDPDKFDKQKPVVCLILPFRQVTLPYLEVTLSRLIENFDEFKLGFVSFKHKLCHLISKTFEVRHFDLSPKIVSHGLSEMFSTSATQEYRMPSPQAGVSVNLIQNEFLYLNEHLQILYHGCEDLPEFSNDPTEAEHFFEEHRKSFISGNQISLVSLYDNHDAKREIGEDIRSHVQRLLDQGLTRSLIVEIRHSPGTGGSTIARRVIWDLHRTYPCAFLKISSFRHYFDEDNALSMKFADRITALEEICKMSPVILIDGEQSSMIEGLSNKLVRMLCKNGRRALLLRCQHGSKALNRATQESSNVHYVFNVNVKLEDSIADLNEFQLKYKEYIAKSLGQNQRPNLCRVFHFPLLSMMKEFRPKLEKIIDDTLAEMGGIQQEIALVVAFLQKYANHATPALLLYEAFKGYIRVSTDKRITYEDSKQLFTEHLLNLMVPTAPIKSRGKSRTSKKTAPERYTLQHPLVADLVLKKVLRAQESDLFGVVRKFLRFPIYGHECFLPLFEELFLYNKYGRKLKFSILFEDLKRINSELAGKIFCEAAVKTNDAAVFANAARFLARKEPPSFLEAKDVMQQAFQANKSMVRLRNLCHTKGVVLFMEMKHTIHSGKVKDLQKLEELASEVLTAYHEARNFPPTYPHPLIGEVEVWLACIDWIMKNQCNRDSDSTLKFLTSSNSPAFFRTCVSDSFYLLDIVDGIVQSVPNLTDPEETQRLSNNARLSLMMTFNRGLSATGGRRDEKDLIQVLKALCSAPNFPRSSQVELKRLQAYFFLSDSDPIDLNHENLQYLLTLLEELVLVENEYRLAYHLMKVCVLVTGPRSYSLEQGLTLSERWQDAYPNDCMPHFYQMAIYFLNILDGNPLEFTAKYIKALRTCQEKSQNHFRSTQSTLFVGLGGQGMSRLITRNTLLQGETEYATDVSEKVSKFWRKDSRKKLLECKGRIRVERFSGRGGKMHPYIELVQGNLRLYVGKNANIGKEERDFTPGALVYFVVSFNLHGPVANGITFSSQTPSNS